MSFGWIWQKLPHISHSNTIWLSFKWPVADDTRTHPLVRLPARTQSSNSNMHLTPKDESQIRLFLQKWINWKKQKYNKWFGINTKARHLNEFSSKIHGKTHSLTTNPIHIQHRRGKRRGNWMLHIHSWQSFAWKTYYLFMDLIIINIIIIIIINTNHSMPCSIKYLCIMYNIIV